MQSKPLACDAIRGSLQRALAVEKKGGVAGSSPRDRAFIAALQHWSQGHVGTLPMTDSRTSVSTHA